jgi:uncharacterized membrane protein
MPDSFSHTTIVRGSISDVYNLWANFENFPMFMKNIKAVRRTGERMSHWVMEGPLGTEIEWDAETTRLDPNERIAWNSKDNSAVKTSGQVLFNEVGLNETEVTIQMHYDPPAGAAGSALAQLFANPEARVRDDLERFKEFVETTTERLHPSQPK